jgi:hypothetical protein|tara:strand:- start:88 stop:285 length:198 start_codon:yes stop_codon:yes gene_type:complete
LNEQKNKQFQKQICSPNRIKEAIFMQNGLKIPTKIWQDVFNIQEGEQQSVRNNEMVLREGASIII